MAKAALVSAIASSKEGDEGLLKHRVTGVADCGYRGDEFAHGGSSGESRTRERDGFRQRDIYGPDLNIDTLMVKGRDFH